MLSGCFANEIVDPDNHGLQVRILICCSENHHVLKKESIVREACLRRLMPPTPDCYAYGGLVANKAICSLYNPYIICSHNRY